MLWLNQLNPLNEKRNNMPFELNSIEIIFVLIYFSLFFYDIYQNVRIFFSRINSILSSSVEILVKQLIPLWAAIPDNWNKRKKKPEEKREVKVIRS